jgi:release factor glutamine methyltransferase
MPPGRHAHETPPLPTIAAALRAATVRLAAGSDTARLDAEVLLAFVLDRDRTHLRAWSERVLEHAAAAHFTDLVERRAEGVPVAYLTGEREFWSRPFRVRPGVLIPRPETEVLVERALALIPPAEPWDVLELGTGSGIIAITLAAERPKAGITATDLSTEALAVARENAVRHGVSDRIEFRLGRWFDAVPVQRRYALIASNPPYVATADPHLDRGDVRFEPALALRSGPDGLDDLTVIAREARFRLEPGGRLLLEHGWNQAAALAAVLRDFGYRDIVHHRDLHGHERMTSALAPAEILSLGHGETPAFQP